MKLIFPSTEHKQAALDYRQEHFDSGEETIHGSASFFHAESYESWLEKITLQQTVALLGKVTSSVYFVMENSGIIGTVSIRHYLNDSLKMAGGHIGYGIRPCERRKGYGTKMLALALEECRKLGLEKVLITCDKENIGSAKVITKNGGIFEREVIEENGNILLHFWISLNIYFTEPNFNELTRNPYNQNLPYTDSWIMLRLVDKPQRNHLQYSEGEISKLTLAKSSANWEFNLCDFLQYQSAHNRNIIMAVEKKDFEFARSVYGNHSHIDNFLRPFESKVLIHSTTKESYKSILQDGYLKSWNVLKNSEILKEKTPIGHLVGDTSDNKDYVMFTSGGLGAERVVASRQKRKIDLDFDSPYIAGARFYFDAEKIAKHGLLIRDGRQFKVKDRLKIEDYLLWTATPAILGIPEETTPRIFAEKANDFFERNL
jgi:predicted acetyltransferase